MKLVFIALLALTGCRSVPSQSVPLAPGIGVAITSSHFMSGGALVSNATATFTPTLNSGVPTFYRAGTSAQIANTPVTVPVTGGYFTVNLADTLQTTPSHLCYAGKITDNASGAVLWSQACMQPFASAPWCSVVSGNTQCNFDAYPLNLAPQIQVQQGPTGTSGATGPQGMQGPQGSNGIAGPMGPIGPIGPQGVGIVGPQGPAGAASTVAGPQGVPGAPGSTGPAGSAGPKGDQGASGAAGSTTYNGSNGPFQAPQLNSVVSALSMQTSPGSGDGVRNALASSKCLQGCTITVEATYPFDGDRDITFTAPGQRVIDLRGGADREYSNDQQAGAMYQGLAGFAKNCLTQLGSSIGDCAITSQTVTAPGIDNGDTQPLTGNGFDWTTTHGHNLVVQTNNRGISDGYGEDLRHPGIGDLTNYWYIKTWGGVVAGADEGTKGHVMHVDEAPTFYQGLINGKSGDVLHTTPTGSTGSPQDLGNGQRIVDTTPASLIATGYIKGSGTLVDCRNTTFTTLTTSSAVTPSKWYGCLSQDIDVPTLQSSGVGTPVCTQVSFGVTSYSGVTTSPDVGDLLNMTSSFPETVAVTAVSGASPNFTVSACVRSLHYTGGLVVDNEWGRGGLELTANTVNGFRYDLDVFGAVDSTHLIALQYYQGGPNSFMFGNVNFNQYPLFGSTIVNVGGVVTVPVRSEQLLQGTLQSFPVITLSGQANSAFNGQCTNVRNPQVASFPATIQCDQAASTGISAAAQGYLTIGDTGYGNSRFNLRPMAEVIDVQTYTAGYGSGAASVQPTLTGDLRLEPNAMPNPIGGTVAMDHHYAMVVVGQYLYMNVNDPYSSNSGMHKMLVTGAAVNGQWSAGDVTNGNPPSQYMGYGGTVSQPQGYVLHGSQWANLGGMDYAPALPGGTMFFAHCRVTGCADPFYHYTTFQLDGLDASQNLRTNGWDYTPSTSTVNSGFLHSQFNQAPVVTGVQAYFACGDANKQLVWKTTPCNQNP